MSWRADASARAITLGLGRAGRALARLTSSLLVLDAITLDAITLGAMLLAATFGQLTRRIPNSGGGLYAYARRDFGDFASYLTGWCYWIQAWAGNAAIMSAWVFYVDILSSISRRDRQLWHRADRVNLAGVRQMAWFQNLTVVLKVLPLLFRRRGRLGLRQHGA
jgi:basic amino acid/polyamine antiporter, APA family